MRGLKKISFVLRTLSAPTNFFEKKFDKKLLNMRTQLQRRGEHMKFTPHDYQKTAIKKVLSTPRVGLFLDMGLGKTVITLTAINELMYYNFEINKVLIIAPLRVAESTWSEECNKWEHLKHIKINKVLGSEGTRHKALYNKADIYIINRENVPWLAKEIAGGLAWDFDMVVIDELSSFKSPKSQRFKALKKYISRCKRVVGLTGTPAPNGMMDLWSQIYLLDGGQRLGKTITAYRERFFVPNERNATTIFNYKPKPESEKHINALLSDICMSMQSEDWLKLPQRINFIQNVKFSSSERKQYELFERQSYMEFLEGEVSANSAGVLTNKLLQYCNGAVYTENKTYIEVNQSKIKLLEDMIDVSAGQPVLCFYTFQFDCERICKKFRYAVKLENENHIKMWNDGNIALLLVHPQSAGHGLNLQQGGHIIVWFGLPWSLELYQQANARLYRQGQKNNVLIHHLIVQNTVDERVYKTLQIKGNVQGELLEALKQKYQC